MYCDHFKVECTHQIITCEVFGKKVCPRTTDNDSHPEPKIGTRTIRILP